MALDMFKNSEHETMTFLCLDQGRANNLYYRLMGMGWFDPYVREYSHFGEPITIIHDEMTENPSIRTIPNMSKSYGVELIKRKKHEAEK